MTITLPHVFQDGVNETASGVQVNEDLNVLKAAIEAIVQTPNALIAPSAGLHIALGTDTLTGIGGSEYVTKTITHGLGKTPAAVLVISTKNQATTVSYYTFSYTSTNFVLAQYAPGLTYVGTFAWVAIG